MSSTALWAPSSGTRYRLVRAAPAPAAPPALDDAQRAVVEHAGGPLLVLAGPGTGKTTTLVEAVVRRIEAGLDPERVLVLTFSRKAAEELRERIAARLGRTVAEPAAATFHSWCYALLRAHGTPPRLLSGAERRVRVRELLAGNADGLGVTRWPDDLRPALTTRGLADEVADLLDRARERDLGPADVLRLGEETGKPGWVAGAHFYQEYLDVLDAAGEIDYAGLVEDAAALLYTPDVLLRTRERYAAVFVDEYQDTDPAQEQLLRLLAGQGRDLVVVGDPDQSIYGFRGADVSGLLEFPRRFRTADGREAPIVTLRTSRRAGPRLLEVSRRVAARIPTPGLSLADRSAHRDLMSAADDDTSVEIALYASVADEVAGIADLLRREHLTGERLPWSRMAVLVRSGVRSIPVLRRAFTAAGVPVAVAADELPLAKDLAVQPLLDVLRIAGGEVPHPETARRLLLSPLGRALPSGLRALGRRLRALDREAGEETPRPSAVAVRDALLDPRDLTTVEDWLAAPVRRVADLVAGAREALAAGTAEDALWEVWDRSGWGRRLAAESYGGGPRGRTADRDLDAVLALFEAASRLEERRPHAGVKTLLDELDAQDIPGGGLEERPAMTDAVRLLTAHRSKGLEWDLVVVCGVQHGVWPDLRRRDSVLEADLLDPDGPRPPATPGALLADERRLFYVAITRAKRRLVVTAVQSLDDAGERPSRFLAELGVEVPAPKLAGTSHLTAPSLVGRLRRALVEDGSEEAAGVLATLAREEIPGAHPDTWWGLREVTPGALPVRPVDEPLVLSGSAVGRYDTCPLAWFLDREVHAARPSTAAQGFGSVVHAIVKLVSTGELPPDPDVLLARMDTVWPALGFEAPWLAQREREEARAALDRFVVWHSGNPRTVVGSEVPFDVTLGTVRLVGSVDRLEVAYDGAVHVVDFKTSKSKPTKDKVASDPQLGVYQLAVREGAFADVEPRPGGAELVQLRDGTAAGHPSIQQQGPPDDGWVDTLVARTAAGIAEERFPARPNERCETCDFRGVCPAQQAGRQVVE